MRDYYIVSGGRLRRHENTVEVEKADGTKRSIPVNDIRSLHLFAETDLNTKVLVFCNQHGIPIHVYNWYGYYSGSFYPREKLLSGFLIVKQVAHYLDAQKRLVIAKEMVRTALHNVLQNLLHYQSRGKDGVVPSIAKVRQEEANIEACGSIAELMGVEGRSREAYYAAFESILRPGFEFVRRSKQPPENMVNALISFGNSVLYATVLTELYHTQLTPTVSYLHEPGERRYSLALDLAEVFKPVIVDRVIFALVNNRMLQEEHFVQELNACSLNEAGRRIFLGQYEAKLGTTLRHVRLKRHVSYQRLIRIDAFKLVKHLLGEAPFKGFRSSW
jgi:CRISPR-associated protein Cas1